MSQALVPDNALLRAFVFERDAGAFDQLAQRHAGMVLGVCQAVLGNGADAEDAAQAVFLTLLTKARSLVNHPTLGGWLHQVAWHVAVRSRRTRANRARYEREAAQMNTNIAGGGSSVPADLLHEALMGLPDKYRVPLVLHHLEGYTQEEAARMLDCKVGTLSGRLTRGRHLLAGRLRKLGVTAGVAAVTGALASATASAAPAGIMAVINTMAASALAGQVAGASASAIALAKGAIHMLFMAKMKLAAMVAAAVLLVGGAGVGTYLVADSTPAKRAGSNVREAPSGEEDQGAVESVMLTADGYNHTLAGPPGRRTYSVATADGQVLFASPVNTPEQTKALDARMLAKLRELEVLLGGPNAIPLPGEPMMGSGVTPARAVAQPRPATTARATGTITGKIVDDAGKPVGGARITLSLPKSATPGKTLATTTSDNNGVFALNDVAPARDYGIAVGAGKPGGEGTLLWGAVYGVNVTAGKTADVGTIKLIRGPQM